MQRVVDLKTEPLVGKRYLVPCVLDLDQRMHRYEGGWIPVFGGAHEDSKILGVDGTHFHIDWRFVGPRTLACLVSFGSAYFLSIADEQVVVADKPRKCVRIMPPYCTTYSRGTIPWMAKLENAYVASTVVVDIGGCRTCPHRGLPLDGLPEESDGSVVCRGHGLCWTKAGTMVRRVTAAVRAEGDCG